MTTAVFLVLFMGTLQLCAQQMPEVYIAPKLSVPVEIDGEAEHLWDAIPFTKDFTDIEGDKVPRYQTRMKMAWDDQYLYFYAELQEPHVWGTLHQRDTIIFYNNDFEIFIDPDGDTHNYMEFEMNALNTVWDLWLVKPYRAGGPIIDNWDIKGLKTAVSVQGTINDPGDVDKGWTLEVAMPWSALLESDPTGKIPVDRFYRINFSRVNWDHEIDGKKYSRKKDENGKYLREYNWVWSPQGVINMHEPEHWGYVYFSENPENDKDVTPDVDEVLKRKLYELWRKQHRLHRGKQQETPETIAIEGKTMQAHVVDHKAGWYLWVESPFSQKTMIIDQDGKYTENK
ncbi:carbohydrate-binding family 9-like protein [Robertkochia solimangrovi]|nr:carbohydrate-binding family 9-like protein [Robertkochia solimangrovi]